MVSAYILIETAPGMAGQVSQRLRQLPFITAANAVTGPYDVICMVAAQDLADIGTNVVGNIQKIEGVKKTLTCLNVDP